MLPIIIFLFAITVSGIAIYLYLRLEQNKFTHKKESDIVLDALERKSKSLTSASFIRVLGLKFSLSTNWGRFIVYAFTFIVAAGITPPISLLFKFIIVAFENLSAGFITLFYFLGAVLIILLSTPLVILFFPYALFSSISSREISLAAGWVLYILIALTGIFSKNRSVFTLTYLAFVILLIINIIGFSKIMRTVFFP